MLARTVPPGAEGQIRALIDDWVNAHHAKDPDRVMAHYAPDNVQFTMAPPLEYSRANARDRQVLETWFSSFEGPIVYEIRDLMIAAGDEAAFCHFLNCMNATSKAAGAFALWHRVTLGLRKVDGRWLIAHAHSSVPFYMDGSLKAAVDLEP